MATVICFDDEDGVKIEGYRFKFVQDLIPERDDVGTIKQLMPHKRYAKHETSKLNPHGDGPFCKFLIGSEWSKRCGVYALFCNEELLYIGECECLHKRFSAGYGNISPRNPFVGGQPTNCKINAMVLKQSIDGRVVRLYFYETDDYKNVEYRLLRLLMPPYNDR